MLWPHDTNMCEKLIRKGNYGPNKFDDCSHVRDMTQNLNSAKFNLSLNSFNCIQLTFVSEESLAELHHSGSTSSMHHINYHNRKIWKINWLNFLFFIIALLSSSFNFLWIKRWTTAFGVQILENWNSSVYEGHQISRNRPLLLYCCYLVSIINETTMKNQQQQHPKTTIKNCLRKHKSLQLAENKDENPVKNRLPRFTSSILIFCVGKMKKFAHLSFFSAFLSIWKEKWLLSYSNNSSRGETQKMKFFHHHHRRIQKYWKESSKRIFMWEVVTWKRTRPRAAMAI